MSWLLSTITNESIFRIPVPAKISCHVSEKKMAEVVTRDVPSSDWLKLVALCLFRAQRNNCAGARPQSDRSILLSNSLLVMYMICKTLRK